jgi:hypothetical protein
MMKVKLFISLLVVAALVATLSIGCGKEKAQGKTTIVVGTITDLTGPASHAVKPVLYALEDIIQYINTENPIPGVKLKLVTYDSQYNPARDIPGYDWCRDKGATVIHTPLPTTAEILKQVGERDKVPVWTHAATTPMIEPPGWVFCSGSLRQADVTCLMSWLSANKWDYQSQGRKPRIGFLGYVESQGVASAKAMREYCQAHPDEFEFVAAINAPMGAMTWAGEVERLKACDFIQLGGGFAGMAEFIKEFEAKGYRTTWLGLDDVPSGRGLFVDMLGWELLDGMLTLHPTRWWGDSASLVELAENLLNKYHSNEAQQIISDGAGYIGGFQQIYPMFDILREAIKEVGAKNFDGQAFYNAAIKFKSTYEGYPTLEFTETARYLGTYHTLYEWSASAKDLVRVTDWIPPVTG